MNFNQLRYIIAVDKHRNFARAADECEVAQSTLSKEIQRLEKEFGVMIFDRSRFPVSPTMKGADLIHQAKIIIDEQRHFIDIAQKRNNLPRGTFRLGVIPMLAPYLIPLFVNSISRKYPSLQLEIIETGVREMAALLESEELDGGISVKPFIKEGFYEDPLFDEEFILYIDPEHPLAKEKEISWNDIPAEDLILHESLREYFIQSDFEKKHVKGSSAKISNVHYQSGSLETIRKIIDRNGGITLLPKLSTIYMGARRLKMVRSLINPAIVRTVVLVTSRGFEKNRITKVIKNEIQKNLPFRTS